MFHVVNGGTRDAIGKGPLPVTDSIGPRVENLASAVRGDFIPGKSLNHADAAFDVGSQRRAHFGHDGALIPVGDRDLFSRRQHQLCCSLITAT